MFPAAQTIVLQKQLWTQYWPSRWTLSPFMMYVFIYISKQKLPHRETNISKKLNIAVSRWLFSCAMCTTWFVFCVCYNVEKNKKRCTSMVVMMMMMMVMMMMMMVMMMNKLVSTSRTQAADCHQLSKQPTTSHTILINEECQCDRK